MNNRMSGHHASIKRLKKGDSLNTQLNDTGVAEHYVQEDHEFETDAEVHVVEKGDWRTASERKKRESFFVCKFKTLRPQGMNKTAGEYSEFYEKI